MKKKLRSVVILAVIMTMALGITGCGSTKTDEPQATPTDEYVYAAEFSTLSEGSTRFLSPKIYTDEGFYATSYEKVGEQIPEGEVKEYEGQYDVYQSKLYFVGFDGSVQELTEYKPVAAPENADEKRDYTSGSNMSGIALAPDGKLVTIETTYESWFDGPEDMTKSDADYYNYTDYRNRYYIRTLDESGKELTCAEISVPNDSYIYAYSMIADKDGNAVVTTDNAVRVIAPDGSEAASFETDNYVDGVFSLKDGRTAFTSWDDNHEKLYYLDLESNSAKEACDLPVGAYTIVSGGGDYDIYFNDGSYLCGFNFAAEQPDRLFNWINCDINGGNVENFHINQDGSVTLVTNTYNNLDESYTVEMAKVSKVLASTLPKKTLLTLATLGIDWDVRDQIINFNRKSPDCRIEIKDYSEFNTDTDNGGTTKLTTELLAGNVPDIIDLNGLPYTQLAAKGILADLYPFIDSDSEFSRDDFFGNIFKALEVNGKLCSTCSNFSIDSLVGASEIVGDKIGWSYDEFNEALAKMPEGCEPLNVSTTRYDMLNACLSLDLNQYVNWEDATCTFESENFKKLLEFTAQFPESFDWDNYEWTEESNEDTRIAEGRQMLMYSGIYSISDVRYMDFYFGGDATFVGYPTLEGTGNMISTGSGFAMSEQCKNKDLAWQFLRNFYTEKMQSGGWGLPTNKNVYEKLLKKEMTPDYQKDAEGNFILDEDGNRVEVAKGSMGSSTGKVYNFYALTEEQADELMELIETTDKASTGNERIYNIVVKHAKEFYSGDKTVDAAVRLIQSEASIYLSEQR